MRVEDFINDFKKKFKKELEEVFTCGYCYWFAVILKERFGGELFYLPVENHFVTKINHRYYDITGDIDCIYPWGLYQKAEPLESARIEKYCILKEEL